MHFTLNFGPWNTVFAVPTQIVDRHLKLAGKEQLRVILWMLRHGGEAVSLAEIAAGTGMPEDSAEDALKYWTENGLLAENAGTVVPGETPAVPAVSAAPVSQQEVKPVLPAAKTPEPGTGRRILKPDSMHIAKRINESDTIRCLMHETEAILGKTLSPALSADLISIHDDYGLPVEVILMILHYAKQVGKTSTSYISSVARDWADQEIFSIEAADRKLQELDEKQLAWKKVETACGFYHRAPSKKEEVFAHSWIIQWTCSPELVTEAYERCVNQTGKVSFAYMNKILEKWYQSGMRTLDQVKDAEARINDSKEQKNQKSYDINELDEMSFFNPLEE